MPSTSTTLRIPLAAVLRHPGNARPVAASGRARRPARASRPRSRPARRSRSTCMLERVPEGIVVRGTVAAAWSAACSRCLEPVGGEISVHVDELFERHPLEGETYQLDDDVIDLEPMVRDALLLELPLAPAVPTPTARACARPAASNRNLTRCECVTSEIDPRWAALRSLEL